MPGGRPPKPAHERRNRARPHVEWQFLPAEGRKGRAPALARLLDPKIKLHEATKTWWREIWKSPVATQWTEGDAHALAELALLRDRMLFGDKPQLAAEVRKREDAFGLTIAGRRALRWVLPGEQREHTGLSRDEVAAQRALRRIVPAVDPD